VVRHVGSHFLTAGRSAREGAKVDNATIATSPMPPATRKEQFVPLQGANYVRRDRLPDLVPIFGKPTDNFRRSALPTAAHSGEPLGPQRVDVCLTPRG
jgi:hypothetical protein